MTAMTFDQMVPLVHALGKHNGIMLAYGLHHESGSEAAEIHEDSPVGFDSATQVLRLAKLVDAQGCSKGSRITLEEKRITFVTELSHPGISIVVAVTSGHPTMKSIRRMLLRSFKSRRRAPFQRSTPSPSLRNEGAVTGRTSCKTPNTAAKPSRGPEKAPDPAPAPVQEAPPAPAPAPAPVPESPRVAPAETVSPEAPPTAPQKAVTAPAAPIVPDDPSKPLRPPEPFPGAPRRLSEGMPVDEDQIPSDTSPEDCGSGTQTF